MKITDKPHNRLAYEKSPYLLQHAYNPVDWYPWCDEAFEKAKAEDKPIFLSIGYSTCHWCHVMDRESFEDKEIADILNKHFISIKVDREERPDIDHIYMTACQALTGQGGWPLSVFMTPERKPFYAGTYFPKETKFGMVGFRKLLNQISILWSEKREKLERSSEQIFSALKESILGQEEGNDSCFSMEVIGDGFTYLKHNFDRQFGGFGAVPKFPAPHNLLFLLRYWKQSKSEAALDMVTETLEHMYRGGIYDHIGFGFSRYSMDEKWLVPHFEKMLYDNALLAIAYLECYQATQTPLMRKVAEEIFTYILRDMTSDRGGFYSAEDADSEGVEGKFYVWTPDEVKNVLGETEGKKFCMLYDITEAGNFEGKSIPNLINADQDELEQASGMESLRSMLLDAREKRVHPHKDDKILTSWNGLMIAALAIGGRILRNEEYTKAAEKAYEFIIKNLQREDGRLLARYRNGEAGIPGYANDYAFMIWACIELYETTYKVEYLRKAVELNDGLIEYFWDDENGGLFLYGKDGEQLILRPKEIYDGAVPSANSQTIINLIRLARLLGQESYVKRAGSILETFGNIISNQYMGHIHFLSGAMYLGSPSQEIIIAGPRSDETVNKMIDEVNRHYSPFTIVIFNSTDEENEELEQLNPLIKDKKMIDGRPAAYICQNFSCKLPVTTVTELIEHL
jgi:uncharacterized protein YyaL (SSP411 family)